MEFNMTLCMAGKRSASFASTRSTKSRAVTEIRSVEETEMSGSGLPEQILN